MSEVELVPVADEELLREMLTRIVNASVPTGKENHIEMVVLPRVLIEQAIVILTRGV